MSRYPLRRALCVAALVAAGGVAAPADAARPATVTVRAQRSAWVERTFRTTVTLHASSSTVSGGTSYAGYYLQPVARPQEGWGEVWFAQFAEDGFKRVGVPIGDPRAEPRSGDGQLQWTLPAGRYRIHVFGDGPAQARLVLSGAGGPALVTATRSSRVEAVSRDVTPATAATAPAPAAVLAELPVNVTANSLSFAATFMAYRGTWVTDPSHRSACIGGNAGLRCVPGAGASGRHQYWDHHVVAVVTHAVAMTAEYYAPKTLAAGEHTAYFNVETANLTERVAVAAFSIGF